MLTCSSDVELQCATYVRRGDWNKMRHQMTGRHKRVDYAFARPLRNAYIAARAQVNADVG